MIIYVASLYIDCEKSLWINFDQLSYFACALSPCFQSHPALQPMPMLLQQRLLHLTPTLALCRPAWCPLTSCPVPPYWSPATPAFPYPLLLLPPLLHRNSWGQTDWRWGGTQTFTHIRKKKWGKNMKAHREDLHNFLWFLCRSQIINNDWEKYLFHSFLTEAFQM